MHEHAVSRVRQLVEAARRIADPTDPLGRRARERWLAELGLAAGAVELAIHRALETAPSTQEIRQLCAQAVPAERVWVVLSANVFTAAHRAIALALASSERVYVKASRRDPVLAEMLLAATPSLFELVTETAPRPGDHVHAYGRDDTLQRLRRQFTSGVAFWGHGSGMGAVLLQGHVPPTVAAKRIAADTVVFDQRGCLSPRLVVIGPEVDLSQLVRALAGELAAWERRLPLGSLADQELAELAWYAQTCAFVGSLRSAGKGYVAGLDRLHDPAARACRFVPVPPAARSLTVLRVAQPQRVLVGLRPVLTTIACDREPAGLREVLPAARVCELGAMQSPQFDGPVDRRTQLQR